MSLQDSLFSEYVEKDINEFFIKEIRKRVLVFPPVNNYRRFIIHQFVQNNYYDILYTFSIGQGSNRRTIVCYKTDVIRDPKLNGALSGGTCGVSKISETVSRGAAMGVEGNRSPSPLVSPENTRQRQVKSVPSVGIYRPPPARKTRFEKKADSQQDQTSISDSSQSSKANRQKRPDRAVYVPRHRRSNEIIEGGNSLSKENCREEKSARERRSKTSSPAPGSKINLTGNSVDDDSIGFDSSDVTIDGRDDQIHRLDDSGLLDEDITERNFNPKSKDSMIGEDFSPLNLTSHNDISISRNFADEFLDDNSRDKNNLEREEEEKIESNSLVMLNGGRKESADSCWLEKPVRVQRDRENSRESINRDDVGLLLIENSEGGENEESVNKFHEEITTTNFSEREDSVLNIEKTEEEEEEEEEEEIIMNIKQGENTNTNKDNSDYILSIESNENAEEREKEKEKANNHNNREEIVVNHKNRRIIRQNLVSDVLLISDEVNKLQSTVVLKEPAAISDAVSISSPPKEKRVKKKIERPKSKPAPPPSTHSKVNRDECDWDSLFDDNGDCLDPTLIEELTTAVGEVTIEQPKSDYRAYSKAPVEVSNDEFAHVVEIYNFPSDFKTSDLAAVFSPFKNGGFELKWVDDTHCLGVFSSPLIAAEVLSSDHSFVKTRPLSEATALSKTKARRSAEFLQPYRARPETCAALARRLVTGALGVRLATARQEREREKIVLKEAKERRRLANKQREDAWEGVIGEK